MQEYMRCRLCQLIIACMIKLKYFDARMYSFAQILLPPPPIFGADVKCGSPPPSISSVLRMTEDYSLGLYECRVGSKSEVFSVFHNLKECVMTKGQKVGVKRSSVVQIL